jgi:uncharacterized phiE125 gp8 family phage protein
MTTTRITDASAEPVTLDHVKAHLRVDAADDDTLIRALITAARIDAENRLQRTLLQSTWRLTLDGFPRGWPDDAVLLSWGPIVDVVSVQYYDPAGALQTLAPTEYRLADSRLEPVAAWPATQTRRSAVLVQYTAGYGPQASAVPAPIVQWILLAIGDLYANRERSAERPVVAQGFADALLDPYRVWAV